MPFYQCELIKNRMIRDSFYRPGSTPQPVQEELTSFPLESGEKWLIFNIDDKNDAIEVKSNESK